jgi:hypothetical protein
MAHTIQAYNAPKQRVPSKGDSGSIIYRDPRKKERVREEREDRGCWNVTVTVVGT